MGNQNYVETNTGWPKPTESNHAKGEDDPETLINMVAALIATSAAQAIAHQDATAPVWIPRNGKDSNGVPYIVITCTECLRSFPLNVTSEQNPEVLETPCLFCSNTVNYIIDFSLSVTSPPKKLSGPLLTTGSTRC